MTSGITNRAKLEIAQQNLNLVSDANIKLVLVDDTYVFDPDVDTVDNGTADDVASHEIAVSGYTGGFGGAGRKTPAGRTFIRDDANDVVRFDFSDVTWSSLGTGVTIGGVVLIKEVTSDADSIVIAFDDLTENKPTNGSDITYSPSANGMIEW